MTKITDDNSTEETETMNTTDNYTELHPLVRAARVGTYLKEVETLFYFIISNMGNLDICQKIELISDIGGLCQVTAGLQL